MPAGSGVVRCPNARVMSSAVKPCLGKGMGGRSTCNVLFWNVHGQVTKTVGNKFEDAQFLNLCQNFDILGLAELHTTSKPSIKGFKLIKDKIRQKNIMDPKYPVELPFLLRKI